MTHLDNLEACPLDRKAPFGITNVSQTQFSIARHSGAILAYGERYQYLPDTDELIRADVLKWKQQRDRQARRLTPVLHPDFFS